jgi:hypothetical protein
MYAPPADAPPGLVPSSPLNTFMQWLGRSNALYRIAQAIPEVRTRQQG